MNVDSEHHDQNQSQDLGQSQSQKLTFGVDLFSPSTSVSFTDSLVEQVKTVEFRVNENDFSEATPGFILTRPLESRLPIKSVYVTFQPESASTGVAPSCFRLMASQVIDQEMILAPVSDAFTIPGTYSYVISDPALAIRPQYTCLYSCNSIFMRTMMPENAAQHIDTTTLPDVCLNVDVPFVGTVKVTMVVSNIYRMWTLQDGSIVGCLLLRP
jgi:hypothetical protein